MKVAIDIREAIYPEPAGKGIYNLKTTQELIKHKGIKWVLLSDRQTDIFKSSNNVEIVVLDKKGLRWHWAVRKYLQENPVDHYFAPTSYITPFLIDTPYTIVVHDLISFLFPKDHAFKPKTIERFFLPKILKKASNIAVVSENTKEDLVHLFPKTDLEKITVTHCGVNAKDFKPQKGDREEFIFTVSTLIPRKNMITLIRAFNKIKDEVPHTLKIAGGKGSAYPEIQKYISDYDLQDRIQLLGYVSNSELKEHYSKAQLFVYPSLYEGFGIPILEAFASGCPVICSNNSSIPEVVGECAVMFRSLDHEDLAKKMIYLLKSKEDQEIYSQNGLQRVKEFSWKKVGERLLKLFTI